MRQNDELVKRLVEDAQLSRYRPVLPPKPEEEPPAPEYVPKRMPDPEDAKDFTPAYRPMPPPLDPEDEKPEPRFPPPEPEPEPLVPPQDPLVSTAEMVPEEPEQFSIDLDTILALIGISAATETAIENVMKYAIENNVIPSDGAETQSKWNLQNLQLTSEQAAYVVLYGPSRLSALRFRSADAPGFFATLGSWLMGTQKYRRNWAGSPELLIQNLPAPSEVAYFSQIALVELATFIAESEDRDEGGSYERAFLVDAATARPRSLHHGAHQKLLLFFRVASTITMSGTAELRIMAQLFATHAEQALPASEFETEAASPQTVRRYSDARGLGSLLLGEAFVPVAVHDTFHTFERGRVQDVKLQTLAEHVSTAFGVTLEAFQTTMLAQCDEIIAEEEEEEEEAEEEQLPWVPHTYEEREAARNEKWTDPTPFPLIDFSE